MTKHEQLWQEFCKECPHGENPSEGFLDFVITRLWGAEFEASDLKRRISYITEERDELRRVLGGSHLFMK